MRTAPCSPFATSVALLALLSASFPSIAKASAPEEISLDAPALVQMETRAEAAEPRDRCFLYTELLHNWTELAGRALTAGDEAAATLAVQHADEDAAKLKATIGRDSKRLKNAELLLEHSVHRLSDMLRATGMEQHATLQAVLKDVTGAHDVLLAAVFAH